VNTDPVHLATENLLRAALAWTVLLRGGFMLHSASVVRNGRCYLFFGNSGAGKSTIAAICGGQVISDDLTMVLPAGGGFAAIGSPFRGTYTACDDLTERYPVVALFRLRKARDAAVRPFSGPVAFSEFLANLPFVVSEIEHHAGAWDMARSAFSRLRVFELDFRRDTSFWERIDALSL
jgi:energy-coupling factor transporter ATP-binding protein EcfA2